MKTREYRSEDEEVLNRLKRQAFETGLDRMRPDFWRWQFRENPAGVGSGIVAIEGEEIVGFAGIIPKRLKVGDRTVLAAQLVDYMVAPNIRGQYVGTALLRRTTQLAEEKEFALSFGLANKNSHRVAVSKKGGYTDVGSVSFVVRPLRPLSMPVGLTSSKVRQALSRLAVRCGIAYAACFRVPRPPAHLGINPVTEVDPRFDALWQDAARQIPVAFVRDGKYLEWRYLRHPVYAYRVLRMEERGQLLGWVVLNQRSLGTLQVAEIVDWLISPAGSQVGPYLFGAALSWVRETNVSAVVVRTLGAPRDLRWLRRQGYLRVPQRLEPFTTHLVVRCRDAGLEAALCDPTQWFWTCGDSDAG